MLQKLKNILTPVFLLLPVAYSIWRFEAQHILFGIIAIIYFIAFLDCLTTRKLKAALLIQLAITFIFLDLSFRKVDWRLLLDFWKDITFWQWIPLMAINIVLSLLLRSYKWKFLFKEAVPLKDLATATFIGFLALAIFPARIGEFIRGFILADRTKMGKSSVLTTIFLERVFDGIGIFTMMIAVILMAPSAKDKFLPFIIGVCVLYFLLIVMIILFYFFTPAVEKITLGIIHKILPKYTEPARVLMEKIYSGLHLFTNIRKLLIFLVLTIALWWIQMLTTFMLLKSVGFIDLFQVNMAASGVSYLYISLLMLVLICFAVAIPAGPGGAGPYQYIVQFTVVLLNPAVASSPILLAKAAGLSIYLWLVQNFVVICAGAVFFFRNHYSFKQLNSIKKDDA